MSHWFRSFAALLLAGASVAGHAQNYPSKPIKLIVPYAVGQGTDIAARYVAMSCREPSTKLS